MHIQLSSINLTLKGIQNQKGGLRSSLAVNKLIVLGYRTAKIELLPKAD